MSSSPSPLFQLHSPSAPVFLADIDPARGGVMGQSLMLGATQIAVSLTINSLFCLGAGSIALFLAGRPTFVLVQRWLMATVLGGLAVRLATESGR